MCLTLFCEKIDKEKGGERVNKQIKPDVLEKGRKSPQKEMFW